MELQIFQNAEFGSVRSTMIGGEKISCMHTHGEITMKDGLAQSCNIVFAELAERLGKSKMTATAEQLGFNSSYTINGTTTAQSTYIVNKANKNDLAWSGIGQYTLETNPMHMAIMCGAIANGGSTALPDEIKSGAVDLSFDNISGITLMDSELASKLDEYMRYDVTSYYGDGRRGQRASRLDDRLFSGRGYSTSFCCSSREWWLRL